MVSSKSASIINGLFNSNFKLNFQEEINSAIDEQQRVCSFIESNLYLFKIREIGTSSSGYRMHIDKENIDTIINKCLKNFGSRDVLYEILDAEDNKVFSNSNIDNSEFYDKLDGSVDKINYIVKE